MAEYVESQDTVNARDELMQSLRLRIDFNGSSTLEVVTLLDAFVNHKIDDAIEYLSDAIEQKIGVRP